jgi:hypothetical protein
MEPYQNLQGTSGVVGYEIEADAITVEFKDGGAYRYTYNATGPDQVEDMKKLARDGAGLNTYINKHTRDLYQEKVRERQAVS